MSNDNTPADKPKRTRTRTPVDLSLVDSMSGDEIKALIKNGGEKGSRALGTMLNAVREENEAALKNDPEYQRRFNRLNETKRLHKDAKVAFTPDANGKRPADIRVETLRAQLAEAERERDAGEETVKQAYASMVDAKKELDAYSITLSKRGIQVPVATTED